MVEKSSTERDRLARIRTLFALERNYLAEERTQLARFRTGIALTLMVPPFYIYSATLKIDGLGWLFFSFYFFLVLIFLGGILMVVNSRSKLKRIRKKMISVKAREKSIYDSSQEIRQLFGDSLIFKKEKVEKKD